MRRMVVAVWAVALLTVAGFAGTAGAARIDSQVELGGGGCALYTTWTTTYPVFEYPVWRFYHTRWGCFPWGAEVLDRWVT